MVTILGWAYKKIETSKPKERALWELHYNYQLENNSIPKCLSENIEKNSKIIYSYIWKIWRLLF